jgi:16S rRNA pseudouridine516 synthase
MRLDRFLESKLAASARSVRALLVERAVRVNGEIALDARLPLTRFCRVEVHGRVLQANAARYLMLHKPRGCVSATRDRKHPTVLDLLDVDDKESLHIAGRLDVNTTGLMLLTNDGAWSSRIMLPERKLPKTYRVCTRDPITPDYAEAFLRGIHFGYEDLVTRPAALRVLEPRLAELTLHEGRYHQVRRMFGHFRNAVLDLHRVSIGAIVLDPLLAPGAWRALTPEEIASVA